MTDYDIGAPASEPSSTPLVETMFVFIAPFNLLLAVFVLFLNITIVREYYRDRKLPPAILFMLIAIMDAISALAELPRSTIALICTRNDSAFFPIWFTLSYLTIGFWSYNCSIFSNVVLVVIKSINVAVPFHQLKKVGIVFVVVLVMVFWAIFCIIDVEYYANKQTFLPTSFGCEEHWIILEDYDFIGNGIALHLFDTSILGQNSRAVALKLMIVFEYMLPCFIVLVCMVIQIIFIRKTLGNQSSMDTANQVNLTVFMISMLYFICNSAYGIFFLAEISLSQGMTRGIEFMMKYTLPLLNAALFPIILICRKESLRRRYAGYWRAVLGFPRLIRRRAMRGNPEGYAAVPGRVIDNADDNPNDIPNQIQLN